VRIAKANTESSLFAPLEKVTVTVETPKAVRIVALDGSGRPYVEQQLNGTRTVAFRMRGDAGTHRFVALNRTDEVLEEALVKLAPKTSIACVDGPYAKLFLHLQHRIEQNVEAEAWVINNRRYNIIICWSRDHVYTLKAAKYFMEDVKSGLDYYLDMQTPNGMLWDNIEHNRDAPSPSYFGEALGKGWWRYDDDMKIGVRRVPVLADTEYVWTEGVWYAWKATGDDAWMAKQLPRLEKALTYMTSDPLRWSKKHGLVRRSFTADEWDFANPHYCAGDHRVIHKQDPTFFFHGNNSGMYAMYWRMAEMYEHLGNTKRASELRAEGEALRKRANAKMWFKTHYGHMIPESLPESKVYALVGDERERMSLSTGYTINRGMPTHAMAVKIIKEYQRRGKARKQESFAEWWTMDPPYTPSQWPAQHTNTAGCPEGEYMNGGICSIIAGEMSKAAFDHGCEDYAVGILDRLWKLMERDNGNLHQVYRRLHFRVVGQPEIRQHRVGWQNRGQQPGFFTGGRQRRKDAPHGRARLLVADDRRDVRFDLVLAGLAVKLRADAQPLRVFPVDAHVVLHLVFGRRRAIGVHQPQFDFSPQRAHSRLRVVGFLHVAVVDAGIEVVLHQALQQRLFAPVAGADRAGKDVLSAVHLRQQDIGPARIGRVKIGRHRHTHRFRKTVEGEFIILRPGVKLLERLVKFPLLVFDFLPGNCRTVSHQRFIRWQRCFHKTTLPRNNPVLNNCHSFVIFLQVTIRLKFVPALKMVI